MDILEPSYFKIGEPNGDKYENCAAFDKESIKFMDYDCEDKLCGLCYFESLPRFELETTEMRIDNEIDKVYFMSKDIKNGKYVYKGIRNSQIVYKSNDEWQLIHNNSPLFILL